MSDYSRNNQQQGGQRQFKNPNPKKTVASTRGWSLIGEKLPGAEQAPTCAFDIGANNPRIRVYANKDDKYIQANLGGFGFCSLLGALKLIRESSDPVKYCLVVKHFYDNNGTKHDQPIVQCRIWVGRDKSGVIFLTVQAEDFELIKFKFLPTFFNRMENENGDLLDESELSNLTVDGFMSLFTSMYGAAFAVGYSDNNNQSAGGGGGNWKSGGGNNWKGGQGGGNWKGNNNNWKGGQGGGGGNWKSGGGGNNWKGNQGGGNNWKGNNQGGGGNNWKGNNQDGGGNEQAKPPADNGAWDQF